MWKYFEENICTDNIVATYYNNNNIPILNVRESRDSHYTIPIFPIIKPYSVSYQKEFDLTDKQSNDTTDDILLKRLKKGCKLIEKDYKKQLSNLSEILNILLN